MAEVFLTGARRVSDREWLFDVQISRGHVLLPPRASTVPLTLCIEAIRQMGLYMAHTGYDVPLDWAFTLQGASFAWADDEPVAFPEFAPIELSAYLLITDESYRKGSISGLSASLDLFIGDRTIAHGTGALRCISPANYRALRRGAPLPEDVPRRYDPAPVRDLRETADGFEAVVGYDHGNPFFFDHPVDHIPGMLLLNAMHHLFDLAEPHLTATTVDMSYGSFPEFDPAVLVTAVRTSDRRGLEVSFLQNGSLVAQGTVTGAPVDAPAARGPQGRDETVLL